MGLDIRQVRLMLEKKGLRWDKERLTDYLKNPKDFLKTFLGAEKVQSKMPIKLKKLTTRENIVAYLENLN